MPPPAPVEVRFDVPAVMGDGVVLAADVYAPAGPGAWPVLLMRTPYGKGTVTENAWSGIDPVATAGLGFLVVIQDVRGRFASGGDWDPLRLDASDGAETIDWAAGLLGSDGRVAMFGGSFSGNTLWQAALARPSVLAAATPLMTWARPDDGVRSRGGALELGLNLSWALLTGIDDLARRLDGASDLATRLEAVLDEYDDLPRSGFWLSPTSTDGVLARHDVRDLGTASPSRGQSTEGDPADLSGRQPTADVPTLHTAGWYDIFLQGTLDNHQALVDAGVESCLVVGPWSHENFTHVVGEVSFGVRAGRDGPAVVPGGGSWHDAQLSWFQRHLGRAGEDGVVDLPAARIFVMGRNEWRSEPVWPPADAHDTELFLHGDGSLSSREPDAEAPPASYSYDLSDPVPTVGGNTFISADLPAGPADQRPVEARPDVLTFTSEVLADDVEIAGRVWAHLFATTSATSADWVVRLCDVHPDGRSVNVCDGVLRTHEARSQERLTVDLWSTSMVFLAGHRIRVQVTNSSFPRWDRATSEEETESFTRQEARLLMDREHASAVVLPVLARDRAAGG